MKIKNFIMAIWQLPQNIAGFIVKKVCNAKPISTYKDATVYSWKLSGGMSLGKYIFVPFKKINPASYSQKKFIKHEYGHTVQSKILGCLYLLVIGLPSLIWAWCFEKYRERKGKSYYSFYTEKLADKLGGVERKDTE